MEKRILIYGAGGHCKTVISLLRLLDWSIAGVIDDNVEPGTSISGIPVLGKADLLPKLRVMASKTPLTPSEGSGITRSAGRSSNIFVN